MFFVTSGAFKPNILYEKHKEDFPHPVCATRHLLVTTRRKLYKQTPIRTKELAVYTNEIVIVLRISGSDRAAILRFP